ncbi:MAG: type III secretion system chaperone [Burkholderiaceae bacterium]|nr:type III secretion system chaperone [Burkholderiaceae bacterium]
MATNLHRMHIMMEEIGPFMPSIEAVIQSEEKNWAIQFDDQSIVMLEWAEKPDRVVLTAMLGAPSESMQLSVYETLLCYNLLWKDTGGVKMALSGPGGELILLYELFSTDLTLNELQTVLTNFVSIAQVWSVYVTGESDQPAGTVPGSMDMLQLGA